MSDVATSSLLGSSGKGAGSQIYSCIANLVDFHATTAPGKVAVLAPGHAPLAYAELAQRTFGTVAQLRRFGIAAADRVAVVMPRGAEHGLALLAVAAAATCVPVNPDYTADELKRYFADLKLAALVIRADMKSASREVARELGIAVIDLLPRASEGLGAFELVGPAVGPGVTQGPSGRDDDAFILLTSGTAARPKMVPLTQASVCLSAYNAGAVLSLVAEDRLLNVLPLFHAHGLISGLLTALAAGSSVILTSGFDAVSFFGWLKEFGPTWYTAVPTIHRALLSAAKDGPAPQTSLRLIRSASASLAPATLEGLERLFGVPVIETYGMTEGASQIAANPRELRKTGSVGRAAGPEIAIHDGEGQMVPIGEHGEIVLRGPTMTRGYYNDPEATNAAFGDGWFRTGDLGYLDADGYLFIVGRIKDVINRGGQKVSPSEVEEVLLSHADVLEAGAFAIPHKKLGENVAAVVTLRPNRAASASELRQFVRQRLAAYKVPSLIRIVPEIPKGASGKIKRGELAGLIAGGDDDAQLRRPRSELESFLTGLWAKLLEIPRIGVDQDVFALGADSLVVTQMLSRLRGQLGVHLSFGDVFDAPTVAALADRLQSAAQRRGEGAPLWRSAEAREAHAPLSFQQQRMYLLSALDPTEYNYNILEVARLSGPLDVVALQASLDAVCARHDILRATFAEAQGELVQTAHPTAPQLERVDARSCARVSRAGLIRREAMRLAHHAFRLESEPPLRVVLLDFGKTDHALIVVIHHLATDGWSQRLFWQELAAHYTAIRAGQPAALPQSPYQYRDFAAWQHGWAQTEAAKEQLSYWRWKLDGVTTLPLRSDRPRPDVWSGRGARHDLRISRALSAAIRSLSQSQSVTPFMTLLAAFQCLLYRLTGHEDLAVGSLIANRNRIEAERLIGLFANTIVLRTELSGEPGFAEVLRRVRQVTLEAYRNQDLPIEEILRSLQVARSRNATPLFQVMFVLQNASIEAADFPGLSVARMEIDQRISRFDITLELTEIDGEFHGFFEYATDLFEASTIVRMAAQFEVLLRSITADPQERISRLAMLPAAERHRLVTGWNGAATDTARRGNFSGSFTRQVKRAPRAVAVSGARQRLSYSRLDRRSRAIAHVLSRLGVGAEMVVALLVERSADLLAAMIAVQRIGAAFVSLDPAQASARLASMLESSDPCVIVVARSCARKLREVRSAAPAAAPRMLTVKLEDVAAKVPPKRTAPVRRAPSSLAYVIHTSGSSGTPKGVMIEQRGLANHLASMIAELDLSRHDVIAQTAPQSFVISMWQFLAGPMVGARVHICADAIVRDPLLLAREIMREGVTVLQIVPSLLRVVVERADEKPIQQAFSRLRLLISTGEPLTADLCRAWFGRFPSVPLINAYGASECSDDVSLHRITAASLATATVPVGRPLPNTNAYVLDQHLQPVPTGAIGELYIGGAGVARCYLNDPALTRARFLPDPFSARAEARLYRTGDLARWRADGILECLGRADQQVKIRGYRIELKEIEHVLLDHPDVREAIAELRRDASGEARLVAYVVANAARSPNAAGLRDFLKIRLPVHAIPAAFLFLDRLPLNAHGKVDRSALQAPSRPAAEESGVATSVLARHATEQTLSRIWSDLLSLRRVGPSDNFFDLGGHSLLAGQVMGRIARAFGVSLPIKTIFEAPTVERLARRIDAALAMRTLAPSLDIRGLTEAGPGLPSFTQDQMMGAERELPGLPQFNLPFALRLEGPLDLAALKKALVQVVRRHEALRTAFDLEGEAVVARVAARGAVGPLLEVIDMDAGADERVRRLNLKRAKLFAEQEAWEPIDPSRAPLLRARLLRLSSADHLLLLTFHHAVADGWSIGLLFEEIAKAYSSLRGRRSRPPVVAARPFSDFARWQRQWCGTDEAALQLAYWRENLRGVAPVFGETASRRRPGLGTPTAHQPLELQNGLVTRLTRFSAGQNGTLFMGLLTGLKVLLLLRTGRTDLCVATAMANRTPTDMERVIGPFENTVIVRTELKPELSFVEAFARVRRSVLEAHARQQLPFNILVARLAEEESIDPAFLIQVYFTLQNPLRQPLKLSDVTVRSFGRVHREGQPVLPIDQTWLSLMLKERRSGITGSCVYKSESFGERAIMQWMESYAAILSSAAAHPDMPLARLLGRKAA
ncbi:non-ribosomal peptide synthetase [Bradyrhizobium sp. Tv2a-2]|uniref:non-ribosomal peptide synthetase n=1 Tax=Bradyrhizobium sp. Tv2a-2 TaxID=113395 RepID=UPI00041C60C0|nr:non-ribosomal peptide synthetase [Bradyrhizobium sp. Tv2a-2]